MRFVPLDFNPVFEEHLVEVTQNIALASSRVRSRVVCGSAIWKNLTGAFDNFAFPGAVAAVWKRWRGAWLEEGEAGTRSVRDCERGVRKIDGFVGD